MIKRRRQVNPLDRGVCARSQGNDGDRVIVELWLNGTHKGPLELPAGTIPPTGKEIHAPCCDVFLLVNGRVKSFHCYTAATILLGQLSVLGNLGTSFGK